MNKKALITVKGKQNYENTNDSVELTTVGSLEELDDKYIIKYKEEREAPLDNVNITVKIYKDESAVEMTRSGKQSSMLIIEKGKRNLCRYSTEFGDIMMGIFCKHIESSSDENGGTFDFDYDIDINGSIASRNEVKIDYQLN